MKANFERVIEVGMQKLEDVREKISSYAESAEEAVKEAKAKMVSLNGFVNSLEDRAFTKYDPILVGQLHFPENAPADTDWCEVRIAQYSAPLGNFFSRGPGGNRRLSGKYRILVLFQKVE